MKQLKLPTLYRIDTKGKVRVRHSYVRALGDDAAEWIVETGIEDGALVEKSNMYVVGKAGRTPYEQACAEAESRHAQKIKKDK